ncbi:hypothetical protein [Haemophilus haemolyticus]|jgi:hypothetical protein|uniref:hypothetical protein n=1 Tax=Haemophilus haemolyticus TaxID=726 RepID=UPI000E581898|nr:hypothetical protein [Haemophilus haemolyticus]MDU7463082.1 hypothetical protein [Haemophilus haemolyticus]
MKIENTKKEVKSYKGILTKYQALPENIQKYFGHIPKLINDDYEYEIVIAYLFLKIEEGQNRLLYGGSVKCLGAEAEVATSIINYHHLKRNDFGKIYNNIFGCPLPENISKQLKKAENTRDRVVHGKKVKDDDLRDAIIDCFEYARLMNQEIATIAGFTPFGDMRGFKGRAESLNKNVTRILLKGVGFEELKET